MKSESEIRAEIERIEAIPQLGYPNANVVTNAPLALEQVAWLSYRDALYWMLGEKKRSMPCQK